MAWACPVCSCRTQLPICSSPLELLCPSHDSVFIHTWALALSLWHPPFGKGTHCLSSQAFPVLLLFISKCDGRENQSRIMSIAPPQIRTQVAAMMEIALCPAASVMVKAWALSPDWRLWISASPCINCVALQLTSGCGYGSLVLNKWNYLARVLWGLLPLLLFLIFSCDQASSSDPMLHSFI